MAVEPTVEKKGTGKPTEVDITLLLDFDGVADALDAEKLDPLGALITVRGREGYVKAGKELDGYIDKITAPAKTVTVMSASNRLTYPFDKEQGEAFGNGSSFEQFEKYAQKKNHSKQPWTFSKFLTTDKIRSLPSGSTMSNKEEKNKEVDFDELYSEFTPKEIEWVQENCKTGQWNNIDRSKLAKIKIVKDDMEEGMKTHKPGSLMIFPFIEDKQKYTDAVYAFFLKFPNNIPKEAELRVIHHEYAQQITFLTTHTDYGALDHNGICTDPFPLAKFEPLQEAKENKVEIPITPTTPLPKAPFCSYFRPSPQTIEKIKEGLKQAGYAALVGGLLAPAVLALIIRNSPRGISEGILTLLPKSLQNDIIDSLKDGGYATPLAIVAIIVILAVAFRKQIDNYIGPAMEKLNASPLEVSNSP
jgi:hypothetical protein